MEHEARSKEKWYSTRGRMAMRERGTRSSPAPINNSESSKARRKRGDRVNTKRKQARGSAGYLKLKRVVSAQARRKIATVSRSQEGAQQVSRQAHVAVAVAAAVAAA